MPGDVIMTGTPAGVASVPLLVWIVALGVTIGMQDAADFARDVEFARKAYERDQPAD